MEYDKKRNNSPEVIVIDCNEDVPQKKKKQNHKKKCEHKRRRKQESIDNKTNLKITQNVEVTKQVFSCIINLNTNITEFKEKRKCRRKHGKKHDSKHTKISNNEKVSSVCTPQKRDYFTERIVPTCGRSHCQRYIDSKIKLLKERERKHKYPHHYHHHRPNRKTSEHNKEYKNTARHPLHPTHKHRDDRSILSQISSSPLNDEVISLSPENPMNSSLYEDVSLESFRYSDNELDTLIKRTKERERRTQKVNNYVITPQYTSKPVIDYETISSDGDVDTVFSGTMDISIHSLATLVLEPQTNERYSSLSSEHDWTGIELQPTSGYVYQNHQNLVQCTNAIGKSGLMTLENNNEQYFPNYPHFSSPVRTADLEIDNRKSAVLEIDNRKIADLEIDNRQCADLEIDNRKSNQIFSGAFPFKLETLSYSPILDTDMTTKQSFPECNMKQEYTPHTTTSDSTSWLSIHNNDYCNISGYYPIKLEKTDITDQN